MNLFAVETYASRNVPFAILCSWLTYIVLFFIIRVFWTILYNLKTRFSGSTDKVYKKYGDVIMVSLGNGFLIFGPSTMIVLVHALVSFMVYKELIAKCFTPIFGLVQAFSGLGTVSTTKSSTESGPQPSTKDAKLEKSK